MRKERLWRVLADLYGLLFFSTLVYLAYYGQQFNVDFWYAIFHPLNAGIDLPVARMFGVAMVVFLAIVAMVQLIKLVDPRFVPELATRNLNLSAVVSRYSGIAPTPAAF